MPTRKFPDYRDVNLWQRLREYLFASKFPDGIEGAADVTVTTAQLLALNATPKELVAAPGANKALIFMGAVMFLNFNTTAYAGIAAGEDLAIKYTDGSGLEVAQIEATGFLDVTADAVRHVKAFGSAVPADIVTGTIDGTWAQTPEGDILEDLRTKVKLLQAQLRYGVLNPPANAALVLHMLVGEIITGDSPLTVRTYYRVVPTTL